MFNFKNILLGACILDLVGTTVSFSLPIPPQGYELTNDPYFSLDHYTEANITSVEFKISFEEANYESDFGIFSKDNPNVKMQLFKYNQESGNQQSLYFEYNNITNNWLSATAKDNLDQLINPSILGNSFGYYFSVHSGGSSDPSIDYLWCSDKQLNSDANGISLDKTIDHVAIATNDKSQAMIYLDDQEGGGDRDWNDMIVFNNNGNDQPEPIPEPVSVPEPSTLSLFLLGLWLLPILRSRFGKNA